MNGIALCSFPRPKVIPPDLEKYFFQLNDHIAVTHENQIYYSS